MSDKADMVLPLIPEFDGSVSTPFGEWWEKAELVCKLRGIKQLEEVIPLRLTGNAFAVYQQLSEDTKASGEKIEEALLSAFVQRPPQPPGGAPPSTHTPLGTSLGKIMSTGTAIQCSQSSMCVTCTPLTVARVRWRVIA